MINLRVIPDGRRLAVFREGRACRLVGPGIVFVLKLPGTRCCLISVGDRGQLATLDKMQFGNLLLPVELRGPATSSTVRIIGFHHNAVVAAAEDAEASEIADYPVPEQEAVPTRYTRRGFWVGLPVVLFLAVVCWLGVLYATEQIITERAVYGRGVLTTGTVVEKILYRQTKTWEQTHYVAYAFRTPAGVTVRTQIRIEPHVWNSLRENGPIAIRYVPDKPEQNLPDGWHMTTFYYLVGGIALAAALFFSVVTVGMLIKKLASGYRGETHPFLGERPPR